MKHREQQAGVRILSTKETVVNREQQKHFSRKHLTWINMSRESDEHLAG